MRVRGIASSLLVALSSSFFMTACAKHPTAPFDDWHVPEPGPDLRAENVFLFQPSFPIGSKATGSPEPRRAMRMDAAGTTPIDLGDVYVGVSLLPGIRLSTVGSFHGYRARFYANDDLWWERVSDSDSPEGSRTWTAFYGMDWAPPDTGTYTIRVVLDATNSYAELDETNNEAIGVVHSVLGDLSAHVEFRVGSEFAHDVHVGTTVNVIGGVLAYGRFPNVRRVLARDGVPEVDRRLDLYGGSWAAVHYDTVAFTPTVPGTYTWTMFIDPDHETAQSRGDNDVESRTLTVLP